MLSVNLIERTLETGDFDRLLRDLSDNGTPLPLPLRVRLGAGSTAGIGLALRRLVELTYGPTELSRRLLDRLVSAQRPDGAFAIDHADDPEADPLTTAVAVAALERVATDHAAARTDLLDDALARGQAALFAMQGGDGLFTAPSDRSIADRSMTTAFIVFLLGNCPAFRDGIHLAETHRWFEQRNGRLDRHTQNLWDLASIGIHDWVDHHGLIAA